VGGFLWKWRHKAQILPYADVIASAFPTAWVFGRSGCSVAHDHPGQLSDLWFAVKYPGGGRFDLGLYEMLLTIPLALAFLWLRQKPRPWGFYCGGVQKVPFITKTYETRAKILANGGRSLLKKTRRLR